MTSGRLSVAGELSSFGEFSALMTELELAEEYEDIEIHMCSQGGDMETGLAMAGRILDSDKHVTTVGFGGIQSAAVIPFIVADYRCLHKLGFIMMHNMIVNTLPNEPLPLAESFLRHVRVMNEKFYELLGEYTKKKANYWKRRIEGGSELYIYPDEALELGLCDEVLG